MIVPATISIQYLVKQKLGKADCNAMNGRVDVVYSWG